MYIKWIIFQLVNNFLFPFRSPGGTPLKPKASSQATADPASMIARALQKKFANQNFHSPENDKENDNHDFSSADENSPHVPVSCLFDFRKY